MKNKNLTQNETNYRLKIINKLKEISCETPFITPFYFTNTDVSVGCTMNPSFLICLNDNMIISLYVEDNDIVDSKLDGGVTNWDFVLNETNFFATLDKKNITLFENLEQVPQIVEQKFQDFYEEQFGTTPEFSLIHEISEYLHSLPHYHKQFQQFVESHNIKNLYKHIEQTVTNKTDNTKKHKV